MKIYFGHPINMYDTDLEKFLLECISNKFSKLENPNQPYHDEGYKYWSRHYGDGMGYFMKKVLPSCNTGIFLSMRDGKWSSGVLKEMKYFHDKDVVVYRISLDGTISVQGSFIPEDDVLSIKETRLRLYDNDRNLIPY
jgi:hypothetical protein